MLLAGLLLFALWGCSGAQQDPGMPYPLQLFHLAPSAAALLHTQQQQRQERPSGAKAGAKPGAAGAGAAVPSHRMVPPAAVAASAAEAAKHEQDVDEDSDASEVGRFQAADGVGRAIFGYLLPDQTRVEQRSPDGSVHGAYSYLDNEGRAVKVQYWDAGSGFHAATNHLPAAALGLPLPPQDTPEVQAARDAHLQQVQAALLQHAMALDRLEAQKQQQQQQQQPPQQQQQQPPQQQQVQQDHLQQQHPHFPLQPPHHAPVVQQQQKPVLPQEPVLSDAGDVADGDSLVVESDGHQEPASDEGELTRYPDLQQVPQALYDPSHVHDPYLEAVIVDADAPSARARGKARALGKPIETPEKKSQEPPKDPLKAASNLNNYYMFWHTVPMYVEVKTVQDEPEGKSKLPEPQPLSISQKAAFVNAKPPSAVHSFQVPPSRTDIVLPQLPIFLSPHDTLPLSYSAKATYFHSIPVAAVHDAQVHPGQRGSIPDHQTQPVFHLNPSEK